MPNQLVRFQFRDHSFDQMFDTNKIKMGQTFFLSSLSNGFKILETATTGTFEVAVKWIHWPQWIVRLIDRYDLDYSQVVEVQELLDGLLPGPEVEKRLFNLTSKIRINHVYKSAEFEKSALRIVFAVKDRLKLIRIFRNDAVSQTLGEHWEPLIVYHLLTCFDLLGQPDEWMPFDNWLKATSKKSERESALATLELGMSYDAAALKLQKFYSQKYGVKNSFNRFISEILPTTAKEELLSSVAIHVRSLPPIDDVLSVRATAEETQKFLFGIRNNYTHKVQVIPGMDETIFWDRNPESGDMVNFKLSEFTADHWKTIFVANWPDVIEKTVKLGLAEYLTKKSIVDEKSPIPFRRKYYRAFRPDGTEKEGVNRIIFDCTGHEVTREYVPAGLPTDFEWATVTEIDHGGIKYPAVPREKLNG